MNLIQFAAARSARLLDFEGEMRPLVERALGLFGQPDWFADIVEGASVLWLEIFESIWDGDSQFALERFQNELRDSLQRTSEPDQPPSEAQIERVLRWVGVFSVNNATYYAAAPSGGIEKTWVTMADESVRTTHRAAAGQTVAVGGTFNVGGFELRFPGEPVGPPEIWINCRCLLAITGRPAVSEAPTDFALAGGGELEMDDEMDDEMLDEDLDEMELDEDYSNEIPWHGVLAVEGRPTGDKRQFDMDALEFASTPMPLAYQRQSDEAHKQSVVVGRIDEIWREDGGEIRARGVFNANVPEANEAIDGIIFGSHGGVSVDLDNAEVEVDMDEESEADGMAALFGTNVKLTRFTKGRIRAATMVGIPAFEEAFIALGYDFEEDLRDPETGADSADGEVGVGTDIDEEEQAIMASAMLSFSAAAPEGAQAEARRGLDWVAEGHGGDGLESATIERARKIASGAKLTDEHIKRMRSYFARHEVDKKGKGWSPDEDGYPSAGRVAWALWGGDAGKAFADAYVERMEKAASTIVVADTFRDYSMDERRKMAEEGKALPDGSYPIADEEDLRNAIQAIGRAKDPEAARQHIMKRAKDLGLESLIPDTWASLADMLDSLAAQLITVGNDIREAAGITAGATFAPGTKDGPGWITHPRPTARLRRYWTKGKGALKIRWGAPGDFNRCRRQLAKYVNPAFLAGTCANLHKDALGIWPGQHNGRFEGERSPAFALVASAAQIILEAWYFQRPEFSGPTPLTIEGDHIYGHVAAWGTCHIGIGERCVMPPHSPSDYSHFLRGVVETDQGPVRTGPLVMWTGHAGTMASAMEATRHYDNTGRAVADITVGEDEFGIWYSGRLRPSATPEDVFALKASGSVSGDWRDVMGRGNPNEMVGLIAVNVPGFSMPRVTMGMDGTRQVSLIASAGILRPRSEQSQPKFGLTAAELAMISRATADELEYRAERRERLAKVRDPEILSAAQQRRAARLAAAKTL